MNGSRGRQRRGGLSARLTARLRRVTPTIGDVEHGHQQFELVVLNFLYTVHLIRPL
jgi:hypothetical protein